MQRAHPKADLKEQRQEKRRGVEAHPAQTAGDGADAKGADAQEPQIEDRILMPARMAEVDQQHSDGSRKKQHSEGCGDERAAEIFDREFEQGEPDAGEEKTA